MSLEEAVDDAPMVTVEGTVTHLRAHGKKLVFVDLEVEGGQDVELMLKQATLDMPLPDLGASDIVKAEGFYEVNSMYSFSCHLFSLKVPFPAG